MKETINGIVLTMLVTVCSAATASISSEDRARLEMALSCHGSAQPHEIIDWISRLGGGSIVGSQKAASGTEYTLPNPAYVLGFPATRISVRSFRGQDHDFSVYETIFPNTPFRSIASIAGLNADQAGNYQQRVGKNHLFLREQASVTYVTCAMGVHASGLDQALHKEDKNAEKR